MKRCSSCNRQCEDYLKICPYCGRNLSANDYIGPGHRPNAGRGPGPAGGGGGRGRMVYPPATPPSPYVPPRSNVNFGVSPYDHTMEFSPDDISRGKPFAMVNYLLGAVGIFFCLMMRSSEYVKFHVRENCKYIVLKVICGLVFGVLSLFFYFLAGATNTFLVTDYYQYRIRMGGLAITGSVFMGIGTLLILAISVLQIISFIFVCSGRSVEGLIVRHFGFMK